MEEIESWISNRRDGSWTFFFEKCKMFRINWECKQADVYIALKCYRSKDSTTEDTSMKELYKCPFKIVVAGRLTHDPVYTFTKRHNHEVDHEVYFRERFKAALLTAIAVDRTSTFEALYKMVQIDTGIARKWLVPVAKLKKAIKRKGPSARPGQGHPISEPPHIPPRFSSRENREEESDQDDSTEAIEDLVEVGFNFQQDDATEDVEEEVEGGLELQHDDATEAVEEEVEGGLEKQHDDATDAVEEVVKEGLEMQQQQPFNDDGDSSKGGVTGLEPEAAVAEEGVEQEKVPEGGDQKDIAAPKVAQYWEPRGNKDRPVCRVTPMRRLVKRVRRIVLSDSD